MSKKKQLLGGSINSLLKNNSDQLTVGIQLSDIEWVSPDKLRENPMNKVFFQEESEEYFTRLRSDIKERGILVPLISKEDGELLAGHNRLKIAIELRLEKIPVQYVISDLKGEEERDFLLKDNLFRRHLSNAQRIEIYKILYPNFEQRIGEERRGRKGKEEKDEQVLTDMQEKLSYSQIARDTGQTEESVKKQIQRFRKENEKAVAPKVQNKATLIQLSSTLEKLSKELLKQDTTTKKQAIKELQNTVNLLKKSIN